MTHLSDQEHQGNLFRLTRQDAQVLQGCSFVPRKKSLEVQGDPVHQGLQESLIVLGDLAKRFLEGQSLPSDLCLRGNLEIQAHHHHLWLEFLVVPEVRLNL